MNKSQPKIVEELIFMQEFVKHFDSSHRRKTFFDLIRAPIFVRNTSLLDVTIGFHEWLDEIKKQTRRTEIRKKTSSVVDHTEFRWRKCTLCTAFIDSFWRKWFPKINFPYLFLLLITSWPKTTECRVMKWLRLRISPIVGIEGNKYRLLCGHFAKWI